MYSLSIRFVAFILKLVSLFNEKIQLGVTGRAETFARLKSNIQPLDQVIWFHCASLGEYEQGLPVFRELRSKYPDHKIVLSFFSPSGYEIRKHTDVADVVVYLPLDTLSNAKKFVSLVHPVLSIFVKYEIWPNYLKVLKDKGHTAFLISALFREDQIYFKWYGSKFKKALMRFEHIFVQNKASEKLLLNHGISNVSVSGDTRFDRVANQLQQNNQLSIIDSFKNAQLCTVIGSSWSADEAILIPYINQRASKTHKFIIAPHEIKQANIDRLLGGLTAKTHLYSQLNPKTLDMAELRDAEVLIIDNIGLLSKIYSYADIAYVGGGMGTSGLHNILEPAVFGMPIIIGKNYLKFPEANALIELGGLKSVSNEAELQQELDLLVNDLGYRQKLGAINSNFIKNNRGAVIHIMEGIRI